MSTLHKSAALYILLILFAVTGLSCQQSEEADQETTEAQSTATQKDTTQIELTKAWELSDDIKRPESVVYDSERNVLFLSNMAGGATEKNGTGYISRISTDGEMVEAQWATGLNAPKGLAISNGFLYASDIDELVKINLETGKIAERFPADNAEFLNDVTADTAGNVYVSDSNTDAVYRLSDSTFEVWLKGDQIKSPNGLYAEKDRLIIAACGIESEEPGKERYLQTISYDSKDATPIGEAKPIGGLDAIQPNGRGGYFLTDWGAAKVMNYNADQGATVLKTISRGTADLDFIAEQNLLVVPIMMSDRTIAFTVK